MPWGAAIGAGISLIGNSMSDKGGGGGGASQSASKDPWAPAQPWIMSNIAQGQKLQDQYMKQPLSAQQVAAVNNQYGQSDYMRGLIPSLLGQLSQQPTGFDRNNQNARPNLWDWTAPVTARTPNLNQSSVQNAAPLVQQTQQPQGDDLSSFRQQDYLYNQAGGLHHNLFQDADPRGAAILDGDYNYLIDSSRGQGAGTGGFGTFRYGMEKPKAGTQAYKDMMTYFNLGGYDPANYYGLGTNQPKYGLNLGRLGSIADTGIGAGADGDGAGPGGAGATW